MKIACVGGGPAGLYFALLTKLREPGHDVSVLERTAPGAERGWGVTLGQDLLDRLARLDAPSAEELQKTAVRWTRTAVEFGGERMTFDGYNIHNLSRKSIVDVLTSRALEAGVRISYSREVAGPADLPQADLVVVAGGARTRLPAAIGGFGTSTRLGRNKYIWLGSTAPLEDFNYFFRPTPDGWIWAYAYQHSPQASTVIIECAPGTWAGLGFDTMPTSEAAAVLGELFAGPLRGHGLIATLPGGTTASWTSFATVTNERWHQGNVVLAGDAAHTAHFSLGQGTKMGLEDAIALAGSLQRHASLETALTDYETQRKAELVRPLGEARCSAEWFENVPRYTALKPSRFARLQQSRWSPLVRVLPPLVSYGLLRAKERFGVVHGVADRIGPVTKALYGSNAS